MTQRLRRMWGAIWAVALGLGLMQTGWAQAPGQSGAPAAGPPASAPSPQAAAAATAAPQTAASGAVLRTGSTLVLVPALVKTKHGDPVFTLTADSFVVTDDGVEQRVRLEEDSGGQPLALVIVVETG